jgi:Flp pilus assembly protein CpaB
VKRSNRLVILVGVLLAVLAFVAIVILLNSAGPSGEGEPGASPTTVTVLVATEDIEIGEAVTPDLAEEQSIDPEGVAGTRIASATQLTGQPALQVIPAGSQITGEAIGLGRQQNVDISARLNTGEKAIAFQVDPVTGADFLVTEGDTIDILVTQQITVLQETADSAANPDEAAPPRFEPVTGLEDQRTVKAILQDKRVIYVSDTKAAAPAPTTDTNNDGVVDENDTPEEQVIESVVIIFAGTDQDAEIIKFAQNALGEQGSLTALVRHADDDAVEETLGITIDNLVTEFVLRLPQIVEQLNEEATP